MRRFGRRLWWAGAAVLALVVAAGAVALWQPRHKSAAPQPVRAQVYKPSQACLLTPSQGLADPRSAQAWAGLEDASGRTHVQVRYLSVAGQDTAGNAAPYLASLAVGGCQVVVVSGDAEVQSAVQDAQKFPKVQFLLLDSGQSTGSAQATPAAAPANTKALPVATPADARTQVAAELAHLVAN
ncbi:hypothetical protein OG500_03880 [Kitasatospora sp. NBC_01250]|uniref:hypothetical protein n=1 Tax=unclassified Kitasatospora TaxID=2633591 RepID=UPI002E148F37|nr:MULTISPECIES: hypothetical protein [unclassified Kitasatospora]WSJ65289.1 hypothetical protein OG294_03805 [Kitasatospora sp. NBC_01302]